LLNVDNINICIVEGKECLENDYKNWICNFIEIE
jgi:hypothetical protein